MTSLIPTFDARGDRRRRDYSLKAVETLYALGKLDVRRNSHGKIIAAVFRDRAGAGAFRPNATYRMGQRYSHQEQIGPHRVWSHSSRCLQIGLAA